MSKTLDLKLNCETPPQNPFSADEVSCIFLCGDAVRSDSCVDPIVDRLPFEDASFDYVTAFGCLEKISRLIFSPHTGNEFIALMNEVHRVLKPGGIFLCQTAANRRPCSFENQIHFNAINASTFPGHFDGIDPRAARDGFDGAFQLRLQEWRNGCDLYVALRRIPKNPEAVWPRAQSGRISVVVPVFNGERYLAGTLDSLLAQSYQDFEVLCVDDCSTDGSFGILSSYAERDTRIRTVKMEVNLGSASKVLNHALPLMTGCYFVYASQDDLFSCDWLGKMHAKAVETGADAVLPDVTYYYEDEPQRSSSLIGLGGDRQAQLTGREAVMQSLGWKIPGNALWNSTLIRTMGFSEFAVNSDEYSVRRFFNVANKVVFSEGVFFYRQDNANAVTKKKNTRYFDFAYTHLRLAYWLFEQDYPEEAVSKELKSARKGMKAMSEWYAVAQRDLSLLERQDAKARIARYAKTLSAIHPLGRMPRRFSALVRFLQKTARALLRI